MKLVENNKKRSKPTVDRVASLEQEVSNLTMALRVSQALIKQFMDQIRPMQDDLTRFYSALNDVQYKANALINLSKDTPKADIITEADRLRLKDWQESSNNDDAARNLVPAAETSKDTDIVIITSTTPDEEEDRGIFRSKTALRDIANQDIVSGLLGKPVGTKVETTINNCRHVVELLEVRIPASKPEETSSN